MTHDEAKPDPSELFGPDSTPEEIRDLYQQSEGFNERETDLDNRLIEVALENPQLVTDYFKGEYMSGPEDAGIVMAGVQEIIKQNPETGNKILSDLLVDKEVGAKAFDHLEWFLGEEGMRLQEVLPALVAYAEATSS